MAPYLYTRSRVRNGMIPFVYNRDITKDKKYYKMIGNRFCSPAKIIKRYLKRIFESVYGELKNNKYKELNDLEEIDIFFDSSDYNCIFNPVVYSEVLDLYLVYLSLYKKYGFTKEYLDKVILKDTDYKNSKPKFNYFDSSGVKWKKRIKLSPTDRNIILLREIPFFIEDFFIEALENPLSQEIVYMFSFFYLYCLVDYEFMLSNNETISGQESLFKDSQNLIFKNFFDYIIEKNHKDCLKKYTINEEIMSLLRTELFFLEPVLSENIYLDFVDYNMVEEVFKKYNITNFKYNKKSELGFVSFIYETVKEKFGELSEIVDKILRDFLVFIDSEKIVYLTYSTHRYCDFMGLAGILGFMAYMGPTGFVGFNSKYDRFFGFSGYRFSRLRDQDNQLKKRRFEDIKLSRLYLTFC